MLECLHPVKQLKLVSCDSGPGQNVTSKTNNIMFSIYYTIVCLGGGTDSTTTIVYTVPVSTGSYGGSGSEDNEQQGDSTTLTGAVCSTSIHFSIIDIYNVMDTLKIPTVLPFILILKQLHE